MAIKDELKTLGQELQTLVQEKVGTTKFAPVYNDIRQGILNIRQERKAARVLQVRVGTLPKHDLDTDLSFLQTRQLLTL